MSDFDKKVERFKRSLLIDLLLQCTPEQQLFFLRLYPGGIMKMPREKIKRAVEQCEATIRKNTDK